jgi:hypothetical protein
MLQASSYLEKILDDLYRSFKTLRDICEAKTDFIPSYGESPS